MLATILGTVMGLARLSSNWLVAKLAQIYVETFRNIPLALQLFFWWGLLRGYAPAPRQAWQPLPDVFVSNRGLVVPAAAWRPGLLVDAGRVRRRDRRRLGPRALGAAAAGAHRAAVSGRLGRPRR